MAISHFHRIEILCRECKTSVEILDLWCNAKGELAVDYFCDVCGNKRRVTFSTIDIMYDAHEQDFKRGDEGDGADFPEDENDDGDLPPREIN